MSSVLTQMESEFLTLLIESGVAFIARAMGKAFSDIRPCPYYLAVLSASAISHPIFWGFALAGGPVPLLEVGVVIFEAFVIAFAWRRFRWRVFALSLAMNAASYGFGLLYYRWFGIAG